MGETCGLKLVYETKAESDVCKLCHDIEKKQRRYDKMQRDVERWQSEGTRWATSIERTVADMNTVCSHIYRMNEDHAHRLGGNVISQDGVLLTTDTALSVGSAFDPFDGPSSGLGPTLNLPILGGRQPTFDQQPLILGSAPKPPMFSGIQPSMPAPSSTYATYATKGESSTDGTSDLRPHRLIKKNMHDSVESANPTIETTSSPLTTMAEVLTEALARKNIDVVATFLETQFEQASSGEYVWIAELKDIGYTNTEIAQLLYERANDSPWIYFEPANIPSADIRSDHHLENCAHHLSETSRPGDQALGPALKTDRDREVLRIIEELCGLGGLSPSSRAASDWNGTAEFLEENSVVLIRHRSPLYIWPSPSSTIHRLIRVAEGFCTAVRAVQDAGLCCDSFTVLRTSGIARPELQLSRIEFSLARQLLNSLRALDTKCTDDPERQFEIRTLQIVSQNIIGYAIGDYTVVQSDTREDVFHLPSLALQFLCVGFLSYTQAHIGTLQPFFLDTPLRKIVLLGTRVSPKPGMYITAHLVELSCLAGMCQGPVLAFSGPGSVQRTPGVWKYDVRACPRDILDTWGPGELIFRSAKKDSPLAIKIGGGYISPTTERDVVEGYHWDRSMRISEESPSLKLDREVVVGRLVTVNARCVIDDEECWKKSSGHFEELGTYNSYSELAERQFGLQGGPDYLAMTANMVWAKRRGRTIKARNLDREDRMLIPFLDFYWGVRVSFCTGVAQRVSLRHLVADLLPAFATCLTSPTTKSFWESLKTEYQIIERFRDPDPKQPSLCSWLSGLREDLYRFVLLLVRQILETLRDTGLSPDGRYFSVAWPHNGVVNRCLRMSLDDHNKWTPMLADSDDCATFAYISNTCLEAGNISCGGPDARWQGRIHLLETAVLCPASIGPWALRHEQTYFFNKLDNTLFWVRVRRNAACGTLPVALVRLFSIESLPRDVIRRLLFNDEQKRQRRLREKDLACIQAEIVSVL